MGKRVLINGVLGKMGQEVARAIVQETEHHLVGGTELKQIGDNLLSILGLAGPEALIYADLEEAISKCQPEVIIDFTNPKTVMQNIETSLQKHLDIIVGTSGITEVDLKIIAKWTQKYQSSALIVPNFALGAVLLMKYAAEIARYLPAVEIIEYHHDEKIDAPSGTALKTAELIQKARENMPEMKVNEIEKLSGARGGDYQGIKIHSIRLAGLVAHQEVIFGTEGQSLSLRHDSYNRRSFLPGIKLALDKIDEIHGLVYGLEKII